jgi:chemotaxis protein CheX
MNTLRLAQEDLRGLVEDIWGSLFDPPPIDVEDLAPAGESVIGYVDITGGWEGRVLVSTTEDGALAIAAQMLALPVAEVESADLADAIGELANIVGGSVKSCLVEHASLSLPSVLRAVGPTASEANSLEVTALWNDHPLRVRVTEDHPIPRIPSRRLSNEGERA